MKELFKSILFYVFLTILVLLAMLVMSILLVSMDLDKMPGHHGLIAGAALYVISMRKKLRRKYDTFLNKALNPNNPIEQIIIEGDEKVREIAVEATQETKIAASEEVESKQKSKIEVLQNPTPNEPPMQETKEEQEERPDKVDNRLLYAATLVTITLIASFWYLRSNDSSYEVNKTVSTARTPNNRSGEYGIIYTTPNGERYKFYGRTDSITKAFERDYPNATVEMVNGETHYEIPLRLIDKFLEDFPDGEFWHPIATQ